MASQTKEEKVMKYTFKDPTKIIEKQGLISKTGLIEGFVEITDENDGL
ncbi:MAG: hypothetical protein AAB656_03105 [Patescibacteria group bacterium]